MTEQDLTPSPGLTLGPFNVDPSGGLIPIEPGAPPRFTFAWRGRVVHAALEPAKPPGRRLHLRTRLARVPSSARAGDAARRTQTFTLLRGLHTTLPPQWLVGLAPDHGVLLQAECPMALPITATGLVSEVTSFLLALAPYLDVLDEVGLAAPSEAPGNANTCPG